MGRPYLRRLRELHKSLCQEQDMARRVDLLDRMLFVIEAQLRSYNLDNVPTASHSQTEAAERASKNEQGVVGNPPSAEYSTRYCD
jgi:hypothetical protein